MADSTGLTKAEEVLFDFHNNAIKELQKNLDKDGTNVTNLLRQSIGENLATGFTAKGGVIKASISMLDYYEQVDQGRRPGSFPPVNSIMRWIHNRGLNREQLITDNQLAFLIGRKIKEKGTKGTRFFSKVINEKTTKQLEADLTEAIGDDIEDIILNTVFE